jgi:hypothetical protein
MTTAGGPKELIEQAIARGEKTSQIITELGVTYENVQAARESMEKANRPDVARPKRGRRLQPCGTMAAARRHERHGEKVCPFCLRARREYNLIKMTTLRQNRRAA